MDVRQGPGALIAGYRIERLLGRGAMGVVYLAEDMSLGRKVVVKLLAPHLAENENFQKRFVRESRMAAAIDHPNIIPIYQAGETEGLLYIAMRYVEGTDLRGLLQREGRLDAERSLSIITQVARALSAAHARGLVHRDVKPGNILIASGSGPEVSDHVYLTDFGLTKQTSSDSGLTRTGAILGTTDYLAPEQIRGQPLDERVDVYALGCVLYECFTGKAPFKREEEVAVVLAHLTEPPPSISTFRSDVPPGVDLVVARAMAKARDDRYPTALALAADLRGQLEVPIEAAPPLDDPSEEPETRTAAAPDQVLDLTGESEARGSDARPQAPPSVADAGVRAPTPPTAQVADGKRRAPRRFLRSRLVGVLAALLLAALALAGWRLVGRQTPKLEILVTSPGGSAPSVLVADSDNNEAPSWAPDCSRLAFVTDRDGNDEIYVFTPGAPLRNITRDPHEDHSPVWSPVTGEIAFASDRDGDDEIYILNEDGGGLKQLTDNSKDDFAPGWSPDGTRLVFVSTRSNRFEIWTMNANGQDPRQLTDNLVRDRGPVWSPDGQSIAFQQGSSGSEGSDILVMPAVGGTEAPITATNFDERDPAWSPDGLSLAFSSDRNGSFDIFSTNLDGSEVTQLTSDPADEIRASWSPCDRIAFTRGELQGNPPSGRPEASAPASGEPGVVPS